MHYKKYKKSERKKVYYIVSYAAINWYGYKNHSPYLGGGFYFYIKNYCFYLLKRYNNLYF